MPCLLRANTQKRALEWCFFNKPHILRHLEYPARQTTYSFDGLFIQVLLPSILQRQREQSRERITSELGIQLRVNRSIQSEGTFGVLKQDWGFRRFLRRGQKNVYTEILIYAFAFNIQKLYAKDTNQRHGVILHQLKNAS